MTEGKARHDWNQTAAILALLYNAHRDPKKSKPLAPHHFHPLAPKRAKVEPDMRVNGVGILKQIFIDQNLGRN